MRTLQTALQQHLRCNHGIEVRDVDGAYEVSHGEHRLVQFASHVNPGEDATQTGSRVFHEIARMVLREGPHKVTPLHITDDEYASFLGGSPE